MVQVCSVRGADRQYATYRSATGATQSAGGPADILREGAGLLRGFEGRVGTRTVSGGWAHPTCKRRMLEPLRFPDGRTRFAGRLWA